MTKKSNEVRCYHCGHSVRLTALKELEKRFDELNLRLNTMFIRLESQGELNTMFIMLESQGERLSKLEAREGVLIDMLLEKEILSQESIKRLYNL